MNLKSRDESRENEAREERAREREKT